MISSWCSPQTEAQTSEVTFSGSHIAVLDLGQNLSSLTLGPRLLWEHKWVRGADVAIPKMSLLRLTLYELTFHHLFLFPWLFTFPLPKPALPSPTTCLCSAFVQAVLREVAGDGQILGTLILWHQDLLAPICFSAEQPKKKWWPRDVAGDALLTLCSRHLVHLKLHTLGSKVEFHQRWCSGLLVCREQGFLMLITL